MLPILLSGWVHFAVSVAQTQLTFVAHSASGEACLTFQTKGKLALQVSKETGLLGTRSQGTLATELRLWKCALSATQLKALRKVPLAMLFDRKRQLNILINKKKAQDQ